jgi:Putative Actinobacterial Holin-X, holin superfamily III
VSAEAQDLERQIQRVWTVYRENPEAHRNAWALSSRLSDIAAEIARRSLSFDEWQVVYRQALQLSRALNGEPQLVEQALGQESAAEAIAPQGADSAYRGLPARALLHRILDTGSRLLLKQIELARTEVRADLAAELGMARLLAGAGVGALLGMSVLLLAAVAGLAAWLPAWLAALGLGVVILSISAAIGYVGWQRRVRAALPVTRKSVTEDVQWMKGRIA